MFPVSFEWAYPMCALLVAAIACLMSLSFSGTLPWQKARPVLMEQVLLTIGGAVGGSCIAFFHRDFFSPSGSFLWHALFGGAFLGIIGALSLFLTEKELAREEGPSVSLGEKVQLLIVMALVAVTMWYGANLNSVAAITVTFALGALGIGWHRKDLRVLILSGAVTSFVGYGFLTGCFVFLFLPDPDGAGRALSPYYAKNGAWWTVLNLVLWAPTLGAFFGPFHAFFRDKILVPR